MKTYIIGDVHGCLNELRALVEHIKPTKKDTVVLIGDLFDRGPDSFGVYKYVRELKEEYGDRLILVRGNHDDMLMQSESDRFMYGTWYNNGAAATVRSFKNNGYSETKLISELNAWFSQNTVLFEKFKGFNCCHASPAGGHPEIEKDEFNIIWDRCPILENSYQGILTIVGHTPFLNEVMYGSGNRRLYDVLAGINDSGEEIQTSKWRELPETGIIDIDTACVYGGCLTAAEVENGKIRFIMKKSSFNCSKK